MVATLESGQGEFYNPKLLTSSQVSNTLEPPLHLTGVPTNGHSTQTPGLGRLLSTRERSCWPGIVLPRDCGSSAIW